MICAAAAIYQRVWPRRSEIQDSEAGNLCPRVRAAAAAWPQSARAFFTTCPATRIADRIRRERVVSIEAVGDMDVLNMLSDEAWSNQRAIARQELKRLAEALGGCRRNDARWSGCAGVQGLPQKEVAQRLGVNQKTIEKQVSKGSRLLARVHTEGGRRRRQETARQRTKRRTASTESSSEIEQTAGDWSARRDAGDWTQEEQAEFERWLNADHCIG